ncbi:MAG: efflux transporter outer membrane subunit [Desulfatitalea sp.]|nr:efflux transporter outer membrane subunit [Desulfatitalea sp.]
MRSRALFVILLLLLNGCWSVGPDYVRPEVQTPATWRLEEKEVRDLANTAWWEQFNDPALKALVTEGLAQNKDVRIATARVEEFFGRYFSTRGDQFPLADVAGSASRQQVSERGPYGAAGLSNPYSQYEVSLGAAWEIDFWGKYRRASEAARAQMLGTEEARRNVVLTLVTAIAGAYVDLRTLDKQLEITRQTAASRKATLELFNMRFSQGITSELDLSQIQSQYEDAMARIPDYEAAIARTENALSILLGRNPGPIARGLSIDQLVLPPVPAGVPSDVLARRPDILLAEQSLVAANASIGVAKSAYFPSISLTAALGSVSTDLSDLFTGPAETWGVAAPIYMPLFSAGRIGGQVKAAEAFQKQALEGYQQTIQNAFRETEDALVGRAKSFERLAALGRQLKALRNYARLAQMRYDGGYTSYLEVLDADRSLFNVELAYTTAQDELFRRLIDIYKAMGGGWVAKAEEMIPVQPEKEAGFIP